MNRRTAAIPAHAGHWLSFWSGSDPALQAFAGGKTVLGRALEAFYTLFG